MTNGDCNACPEPVSSSCPTTAAISASASTGYSSSCSDSSYSVTFGSLQVAQSDGGDDKFTVKVMDKDGFSDFQNGHSYEYYAGVGTGVESATCYKASSAGSFPAGTEVVVVVQCKNVAETCNLKLNIDATCQYIGPCSGVSCGSHGYCTNGLCHCNTGYSGKSCQNYDPCTGVDCSGNGVCKNGKCTCDPGYSGATCSNYDPCYGIDCSGNGYCSELTGQCNCVDKYQGSDCSQEKFDNKKNIIIIACSSAGGAILLLLLISVGIAVAIRSRRRGSQQVAVATMVPSSTDPKVTLVTAMEQQ